jgi:hypothetical protein
MSLIRKVIGVNSTLPNGQHILMWDFDDIPLDVVEVALALIQDIYNLPNIYILNTGKVEHFIAYSFEALDWKDSIEIVAATPHIDRNYFKYGVYRDHWTLRVSPKEGRKPKLVKVLWSERPETASISELNSWTKGYPHAKSELSIPFSPHVLRPSNCEGTHFSHLS